MKLETVAITVDSMDRALEFYRKLFGKEPERRDERYSFFLLENIAFSLYNPEADGEEVEFGENCVPAFSTDDIESEHERLKRIAPWVEEVTDVNGYRIFHFKDTEGNLLEVYEGEK